MEKEINMTVIPLFDRVVLKLAVEPSEKKTDGGVIIPESVVEREGVRDRLALGIVMSVGPDCKEELKTDQIVLFRKFGTTEIIEDGQALFVAKEENIVGTVDSTEGIDLGME